MEANRADKGKIVGEAVLHSPDTPVPVPKNLPVLKELVNHLDAEQIRLAFARGNSQGGYKAPGLIGGLCRTAPSLHDGGIAAGSDLDNEVGVLGALLQGKLPAPASSLKALVDSKLRKKVVAANKSSPDLRQVHGTGEGHALRVDNTTGSQARNNKILFSIDYH